MVDRRYDREPVDGGSNAALGVIVGVLLVLVLLFGAWWLFFRGPVVDQPDTTIIEQPDVNIDQDQQQQQPDDGTAPDGGTTPDDGTTAPDDGTTPPEEENQTQ